MPFRLEVEVDLIRVMCEGTINVDDLASLDEQLSKLQIEEPSILFDEVEKCEIGFTLPEFVQMLDPRKFKVIRYQGEGSSRLKSVVEMSEGFRTAAFKG